MEPPPSARDHGTPTELAARYLGELAGRRVLVLLDEPAATARDFARARCDVVRAALSGRIAEHLLHTESTERPGLRPMTGGAPDLPYGLYAGGEDFDLIVCSLPPGSAQELTTGLDTLRRMLRPRGIVLVRPHPEVRRDDWGLLLHEAGLHLLGRHDRVRAAQVRPSPGPRHPHTGRTDT